MTRELLTQQQPCGCDMCTADPAEETTIDPKDAE
jgi:hypothetical protein